MTEQDRQKLNRGDLIRHRNGDSYIVIHSLPTREHHTIIAVREIEVSNPDEWETVSRHDLDKSKP